MQVIRVISVILFVVIALLLLFFFFFISSHSDIFFLEMRCPAGDEDCPVKLAVKKCRNRESDYTFKKKKKDWEKVKKRRNAVYPEYKYVCMYVCLLLSVIGIFGYHLGFYFLFIIGINWY